MATKINLGYTVPVLSDDQTILFADDSIDISPEFREFAEWHGTPIEHREIKTESELAAAIRIHPSTLALWKKCSDFQPLVLEAFGHWLTDNMLEAVISLYQKARLEGDMHEVQDFVIRGNLCVDQIKTNQ